MKLDDRDEALGTLLDRSLAGSAQPVPPPPAKVMKKGARRRTGVVAAAIATVAVFVGAVGFAATQFGGNASTVPAAPEGWTVLAAPDLPWTAPIPPGWTAGGYRYAGGAASILKDVRASFVANHEVTFRGWPSLQPLPPDVSDETVIVLTDEFVGIGDPTPSGTVSFNAEHDDRQNAGWVVRDAKVCRLDACVRVYIWHGPDASVGDLDLATHIAEGITPGVERTSADGLGNRMVFDDRADRFTMAYPAGWTVAGSSLSPDLDDPVEIVSVGTFPMPPGGRRATDAYLPGYALEHVGPDDVFITLHEFRETHWDNSRPRPASFDPDVWCRHEDCVDGSRQGLDPLRAWWIPFQDEGRGFLAFVAMGESAFADDDVTTATWSVLDSLSLGGGDVTPVPPLWFDPAQGWFDRAVGGAGSLALTANVDFPPEAPFVRFPFSMVVDLPEDGVVIMAWQVGDGTKPVDPEFTTMDLPLPLPEEVQTHWEASAEIVEGHGRSAIVADVNGRPIQVWIFYGTPHPGPGLRAEAAAALARLRVEAREP